MQFNNEQFNKGMFLGEVGVSPLIDSNLPYTLSVFDYKNNKYVALKISDFYLKGEAFNLKNTRNINGYKELEFQIPYIININSTIEDNFRIPYCTEEWKVKLNRRGIDDYYIIKEVTDSFGDDGLKFRNLFCYHYPFARLSQSGTELDFEEINNAEGILNYLLDGCDWSIGIIDKFYEEDGIEEKVRTLKANGSTNRYELIQNMAEIFSGFPSFDSVNKKVNFLVDPRVDRGIVWRDGKNIKSYSRKTSTKEIATKIWVEGGQNDDGITYIDNATANTTGLPYIINIDFFKEKNLVTVEQQNFITNFLSNMTTINSSSQTLLNELSVYQNELLEKEVPLEFKDIQKVSKISSRESLQNKYNTSKDAELLVQIDDLTSEINILISEINSLQLEVDVLKLNISSHEAIYQGLINQKAVEEQLLEDNVGDFIREKLYKNDNYTDTDSLYADALEVSKVASFPQFEEDISIIDLSTLTGYEIEKFDEYTKVIIEIDPLGIISDGQIREITEMIDDPRKTVCSISTYITSFEDFMSKSFSASTDLQIMKEVYNRAVGLDPNGTVNSEYLQEALINTSFVLNSSSSTYVDPTQGFVSADNSNGNFIMKLNSGALIMSDDGGLNWKLAITAKGIVAESITSGVMNTGNITIGNIDEPNFFIDGNGMWAYDENRANHVNVSKNGIKCVKNGVINVNISSDGDAYFAGTIEAEAGIIAGWVINPDKIYNVNAGISSNAEQFAFWAGETNEEYGSLNSDAKFTVDHFGRMTAVDASLKGVFAQYDMYDDNISIGISNNSVKIYNWTIAGDLVGGLGSTVTLVTGKSYISLYSEADNMVALGYSTTGDTVLNAIVIDGSKEMGNGIAPIVIQDNMIFKSGYNLNFTSDDENIYGEMYLSGSDDFVISSNTTFGDVVIANTVDSITYNTSAVFSPTGLYIYGDIGCSGVKSRVVDTKFGNTTLNAYETADCLFGDVGEGITGDDGLCYVFIDPVLLETINTKVNYQVFLQEYDDGKVYISDRQEDYFIVKGSPNVKFGWELKAKQKTYENNRLEIIDDVKIKDVSNYTNDKNEDLGEVGIDYYVNYEREMITK